MKLEVLNTTDSRLVADVRRLGRDLKRHYPTPGSVVNVVFVNDRRMRELNTRYRKRRRVTDVLAFPMDHRDPDSRREVLGEVYVSRERARAQGREYGTGYYGEARRLVLHGILHLLGLSHRKMERAYRQIL